ncbi:Cation Diffusion Facilitator (CDF) Family [Thraustotheca clavata]|uniref:Cation Diffusion Facilitator (CDF) Family n=1 Tax=Thraustotheca clavata TaxID=74557 RepID=A0A1W0A729_9STRA|nr:Cation Diffusion Facilitator (CDF) Family [Thraustotheca clavata]
MVNHVDLLLRLSVLTNVVIVASMMAVAFASHSLALISALMENMVDLIVQGSLWYANRQSSKAMDNAKFPAGTSRFEPVVVVISATIMGMLSLIIIYESSMRLYTGFALNEPEVAKYSLAAIIIGCSAVGIKIGLVLYASFILKQTSSSSVEAIQMDNRNDTVANGFAIIMYGVASAKPSLWFLDPSGAIVIFIIILWTWLRTGKEQILQLVGIAASSEFIESVKEICENHHELMSLDIIRGYHFGNKYLVELEMIAPAEMTVQRAHDIAIQLQFKVEQLEDVERAFVHVDYQTREYDEHVVSRWSNAVDLFGGDMNGNELKSRRAREEINATWYINIFTLQVATNMVDHAALLIRLSVLTNVVIVASMSIVVFASHSLALISALMENMVDLVVQGLLAYANYRSSKAPDLAKFPAGTSRFEPILVILAASVMGMLSVVIIYESSMRLYTGFSTGEPDPTNLSTAAIVICSCAVATKIGLIIYASYVLKYTKSSAVAAIQQDNRNDTISNSFAIAVYGIAAAKESLWYLDPAGAILIFLSILLTWISTAKEQILQLVGVTASAEFIAKVKAICETHHNAISLDIVRAYHFGNKHLVELEVVAPASMTVKQAHDISIQLQFKVEQLEEVERAFVHVDYKNREYDEHVVSQLVNALDLYNENRPSDLSMSRLVPRQNATSSAARASSVNDSVTTPQATQFRSVEE